MDRLNCILKSLSVIGTENRKIRFLFAWLRTTWPKKPYFICDGGDNKKAVYILVILNNSDFFPFKGEDTEIDDAKDADPAKMPGESKQTLDSFNSRIKRRACTSK